MEGNRGRSVGTAQIFGAGGGLEAERDLAVVKILGDSASAQGRA
jgi:hypothetical protein